MSLGVFSPAKTLEIDLGTFNSHCLSSTKVRMSYMNRE